MGAEATLVTKVVLPDYFSMTLNSRYGQAAANVFFGDGPREPLAEVEKQIRSCGDPGELARLCQETISFRRAQGPVSLSVDVSGNNQLLGACREVAEFKHGYEPEIHCAIDMLTGADAVIFDIGANWGPISLQAMLRDGFHGRIHSFEPQARAYANLAAMVAALSLESCLFPHNVAISDREGTARLSDDQWRGNVALSDSESGEACRLVRLDDLQLPDPQLIKIDVEGHERSVIAGGANLLQRAGPFVIFEDWLEHPKDHFYQLASYGYSFYCLGWYNPFTAAVEEKPPFLTGIQILALVPTVPQDRDRLPRRVNVLASPRRLSAEEFPAAVAV